MGSKNDHVFEASIEKLVHGGQGLGILDSGQKAFVWGTLPGEKIKFRLSKKRSDYVEGVVSEVILPSPSRIEPKDELYLSTSPWQIMGEKYEDSNKLEILKETFTRAKVNVLNNIEFQPTVNFWQYRNKMEYSFYGDESGLHLALYDRGSHSKKIVFGSSIARPEIDTAANKILEILSSHSIRASQLKSLILRCNQDGEVAAALFVKDDKFPVISSLDTASKGFACVYSNFRSPASVRTKDLYTYGDISLSDQIGGKVICYDVFSFFQVNIPVFEEALQAINEICGDDAKIDFYSGVGTIGLALPNTKYLVESDPLNIEWARKNAAGTDAEVVHASSEKALEYIDDKHTVIVDPPRAGLHAAVVEKCLEVKPPKIVYLSCNPSTQARDVALLQNEYSITFLRGYNFFPRTPHIESLAVLVRK